MKKLLKGLGYTIPALFIWYIASIIGVASAHENTSLLDVHQRFICEVDMYFFSDLETVVEFCNV